MEYKPVGLGDTVLYNEGGGRKAAMVTRVIDGDNVDLTVFRSNGEHHLVSVPKGTSPGTWETRPVDVVSTVETVGEAHPENEPSEDPGPTGPVEN